MKQGVLGEKDNRSAVFNVEIEDTIEKGMEGPLCKQCQQVQFDLH